MLSIYLGQMEEAIYYPPAYFNNTYGPMSRFSAS